MTDPVLPQVLPPSAPPPEGEEIPSITAPLPGLIVAQGPDRRNILLGNGYGILSMIIWAAGFPAAQVLLATWDPLALIVARFGFAVALLLPLWIALDGWTSVRSARWGWGLILGAITFGVGAYLLILAQSLTDAVTVAVIAAAAPIAATMVELVYIRRRIGVAFLAGLVASVVGGIVATGETAAAHLGLGALAALVSVTFFSWGSYLTVRDFAGISQIGRAALTLTGGFLGTAAVLVLAYGAGLAALPADPWTSTNLALLALYGFGGMAISQVLWIASVDKLGVAVASFHINIAPFYVMLILVAFGQAWSWPQAIGAGIVAIGVLLAQRA